MRARYLGYLLLSALLSGCLVDGQVQFQTSATLVDTDDQSLLGYQRTVYKLVKNGTCIGCHAATQSPFFANKDPLTARDAVLSAGKVNFQRPELSRLYKRLAEDKHNCWGEGTLDEKCQKNAEDMLSAIYAWREYVTGYQVDMGVVTAEKPFLPGGVLPLPSGGKLVEAEAGSVSLTTLNTGCTTVNNVRRCTKSLPNRFKTSEDKVAGKGLYLYIPEAGRTTDNTDLSMGNYMAYSFASNNANYRIYGRVSAVSNTDDDFDMQVNGGTVQRKSISNTDGQWHWQDFGSYATAGVNKSNQLKVGIVDDGPKFDQFLIVPDVGANRGLDEAEINVLIGRKVTLTFDLDPILDAEAAAYNALNPGSMITPDNLNLVLDISVFDEEGYKVEKAEIVPKAGAAERANNLLVRGVRFMMNQSFNPQDSDWVTVNKVMPTLALNTQYANDGDDTTISDANYRRVSVKPMLVQKQKGALLDKVAIAFEVLDYTSLNPATVPIPTSLGVQATVENMISTYCINCHSSFAADADRTQFVVKNAQFRLDPAKTFAWLFTGVQLSGEAMPRPIAHVRRTHERMMRPPVRLPAAKGGGLAIGGGAEGSAIYRVWRYRERVPAEMAPYVDAISTDSPTSNLLFDKFKAFIDGQSIDPNAPLFRAEVTDLVAPQLVAMDGLDADVGNGSKNFTINWDAYDDVSRVEKMHLDVMKNSSGDTTPEIIFGNPTGVTTSTGVQMPNPRRFDGTYNFDPADFGNADLRTTNFKFVAQAEDESGNMSTTPMIDNMALATARSNIQSTVGNCDVRIGPQGASSNNAIPNNSLTVGTPVSLIAYGQNNFAGDGAANIETVINVTLNGASIGTAVADLDGKAQLPGGATFTPTTTQNGTIRVTASNRVKGSGSNDSPLEDPYMCQKTIQYATNVATSTSEVTGALRLRLNVTSAFTGALTVTSASESRINDATNYVISPASVVSSNGGRTFTYDWANTGRDGNPHTFTISLDFGGRNITTQITAQ